MVTSVKHRILCDIHQIGLERINAKQPGTVYPEPDEDILRDIRSLLGIFQQTPDETCALGSIAFVQQGERLPVPVGTGQQYIIIRRQVGYRLAETKVRLFYKMVKYPDAENRHNIKET